MEARSSKPSVGMGEDGGFQVSLHAQVSGFLPQCECDCPNNQQKKGPNSSGVSSANYIEDCFGGFQE